MPRASSPNTAKSCGCVMLVLLSAVLGYSAVRFYLDNNNYTTAHQAFQAADCAAAIPAYDKVINSFRLFDLGNFRALARQEKAECQPFQAAFEKQSNGEYSEALLAYNDFVSQYKDSRLAATAKQQVESLFAQQEMSLLADESSCAAIDSMLGNELLLQRMTHLPRFYYACGLVYDALDQLENSFEMYTALLAEYPDHELASKAESGLLINPVACRKTGTLHDIQAIAKRPDFMPELYYSCGQSYEIEGDEENSFRMYKAFLLQYSEHQLLGTVEIALKENPLTCDRYRSFRNTLPAKSADFYPSILFHCAQSFDDQREYEKSAGIYKEFLEEYPNHALAGRVESALLANPAICADLDFVLNTVLGGRDEQVPDLFYRCGRSFEDKGDFASAAAMYQSFLDNYPEDPLAAEVEAALAHVLVEDARAAGAGEIPAPERSGSTRSGSTKVIIQNDSPERLRIVFSGPEAHVEELPACPTCQNYAIIGPLYCPEQGPIGEYSLLPGEYDVLVEASSDTGVTPFTGDWILNDGQEYYNCFFIVTSFSP